MPIATHYDEQAARYSADRDRGLLGYVVRSEKRIVMAMLGLSGGETVLDAGCGSGDYGLLVKASGGVPFGVDVSEGMAAHYRSLGFRAICADLQTLHLEERFDRVLIAGAMEFVPDPSAAIQHLSAMLKPQGRLLWLYPRRNIFGLLYRIYHFAHGNRIHLFSPARVKDLLGRADLEAMETRRPDPLTNVVLCRRK